MNPKKKEKKRTTEHDYLSNSNYKPKSLKFHTSFSKKIAVSFILTDVSIVMAPNAI